MDSVATKSYRPVIPSPSDVRLPVGKTALVIIDMQNDFSRPSGSVYIGDMIVPTIPRIRDLLSQARDLGMRVVHTQSWHPEDDPRYLDPPHQRATFGSNGLKVNTWGAEIIDELHPIEGEPITKKDTFDPWFGTNLEQVLKDMNFGDFEYDSAQKNRLRQERNVVITGTASDVCVDKAVIGFFFRGYKIIVPTDCISAHDQFCQDSALYRFINYFDAILTTSDLIEFVHAQSPPNRARAS